jgi:hypothetical protein
LNRWIHVGITYDGSQLRQYQDGIEVLATSIAGPLAQSANPIHFGADSNSLPPAPDGEYVNGQLDEVRIDTAARSPAWIAADHASQTDRWISYGPIELTQ